MRVTLRDYASQYVQKVDGSAGYGNQFRWLVNAVEKELSRSPVYIDEVTTEVINRMVRLWKQGKSTVTARSRRNMLYRLAKIAARDDRLKRRPPKPVRDDLEAIKRRYKAPSAWSPDEVVHLLTVAGRTRGLLRVRSVPIAGVHLPQGAPWVAQGIYFASFIMAVWDTGLRPCDMFRIRRDDIDANGRFCIVQQKTNRPVVGNFRPETMELIRRSFALTPGRELIWPLWSTRGTFFRMRKRLLKRAGMSGGMNKLRHSAGTACEIQQPGSGPAFLGNTPEVFFRHYFDRRHVQVIPQPPPLPRAKGGAT